MVLVELLRKLLGGDSAKEVSEERTYTRAYRKDFLRTLPTSTKVSEEAEDTILRFQ